MTVPEGMDMKVHALPATPTARRRMNEQPTIWIVMSESGTESEAFTHRMYAHAALRQLQDARPDDAFTVVQYEVAPDPVKEYDRRKRSRALFLPYRNFVKDLLIGSKPTTDEGGQAWVALVGMQDELPYKWWEEVDVTIEAVAVLPSAVEMTGPTTTRWLVSCTGSKPLSKILHSEKEAKWWATEWDEKHLCTQPHRIEHLSTTPSLTPSRGIVHYVDNGINKTRLSDGTVIEHRLTCKACNKEVTP